MGGKKTRMKKRKHLRNKSMKWILPRTLYI
jgi:hypothetical protein